MVILRQYIRKHVSKFAREHARRSHRLRVILTRIRVRINRNTSNIKE